MKNKLTSLVVIFAVSQCLTAQELNSKYVANYVRQVTPILEGMFIEKYPDASPKDLSAQVSSEANKMANCQLHAIDDYPQPYKQASIDPIENGESLQTVSKAVANMMKADIQSGALAMPEFKRILGAATAKFRACMS